MLNTFAIPQLQTLDNYDEIIFMQDGATSHTAGDTVRLLDELFGLERVWSGSLVNDVKFETEWPARSPDLTPCDYWAFSYFKREYFCFRGHFGPFWGSGGFNGRVHGC